MKTKQILNAFALLALSESLITAAPVGTAFTYQGRLDDGGIPANGMKCIASTPPTGNLFFRLANP